MFWPAIAALSLALSVNAQQEYIGENRRRGSVDEDIVDYIYADYDAGNGLLEREPERPGPLPVDPPRSRIPQLPKRNNNPKSRNPGRNGGQRRPQGPPPGARPLGGGGGDPLPFNLPPGAVPFDSNSK